MAPPSARDTAFRKCLPCDARVLPCGRVRYPGARGCCLAPRADSRAKIARRDRRRCVASVFPPARSSAVQSREESAWRRAPTPARTISSPKWRNCATAHGATRALHMTTRLRGIFQSRRETPTPIIPEQDLAGATPAHSPLLKGLRGRRGEEGANSRAQPRQVWGGWETSTASAHRSIPPPTILMGEWDACARSKRAPELAPLLLTLVRQRATDGRSVQRRAR